VAYVGKFYGSRKTRESGQIQRAFFIYSLFLFELWSMI
jgi:hypothetical protein